MNNARRILPLVALFCAAGVLLASVGMPRSGGPVPDAVPGKSPGAVSGAPVNGPTDDWQVTGFGFSAPPKKSS